MSGADFNLDLHNVSFYTSTDPTPIYKQLHTSEWIFQKVLAEIVQKGLILSQKALISNRRNFGLFASKSMHFPSKESKSKDLSF